MYSILILILFDATCFICPTLEQIIQVFRIRIFKIEQIVSDLHILEDDAINAFLLLILSRFLIFMVYHLDVVLALRL